MAKSGLTAAGRETRAHIGIYGRCNAGKSSLLNAITGADTAIVSPQSGTTTDIVRKSYEILDFAPVLFLDTAGIDDHSPLGRHRVERTLESISQIDLALLVFREWGEQEQILAERFATQAVPYVAVFNSVGEAQTNHREAVTIDAHECSETQRNTLIDRIKESLPEKAYRTPSMFAGRELEGKPVLLVCPIDSEAPAGRLILPQVQALRELLDMGAVAMAVQPEQIASALSTVSNLALVVTDSQVYAKVREMIPATVEVTSFSILLAAAKGDYELYMRGLEAVDRLSDGARILIAESCTHQVSCDDIGRVKIPRWLEQYTGCKLQFTVVSGLNALPDDLANYALMVQCGGCMVTRSQLQNRIRRAAAAGVAVTNYGMLIRKITDKKR